MPCLMVLGNFSEIVSKTVLALENKDISQPQKLEHVSDFGELFYQKHRLVRNGIEEINGTRNHPCYILSWFSFLLALESEQKVC